MQRCIARLCIITLLVAVSAPVFAGETYDLTPKFEEGKKQYIEESSTVEQKVAEMPMGSQTFNTVEGVIETITKANTDGTTMSLKYDRQKFSLSVMGQKQSYDSDDDAAGSPMIKPIFKPMIGKEFTLTLDKDRKPMSVTGIEEIRADVQKGAAGNPLSAQLGQQIAANLTEDGVKQEWGKGRMMFVPEKPVCVGDTWTKTDTRNDGPIGIIETKTTYKLKAVKDMEVRGRTRKTAVITYESVMSPGKGNPAGGPTLKSGTRSGTIHFDLNTHRVFAGKYEGTLELQAPSPVPDGDQLNITVSIDAERQCMTLQERAKQRSADKA